MLTAAIVIATWLMMFVFLQFMVKRKYAELRREFREQIDPLYSKVGALERMALAQPVPDSANAPVQPRTGEPLTAQVETPIPLQAPAAKPSEESPTDIPAEVLAAIQPFLGQKVRIRSAKLVQNPYSMVKAWAREGRAGIQTSHDLSQHGRR